MGGDADITSGNDGDVMIKFPKIYWKINKLGGKLQVKFSTKEFGGAICKAHTVDSSEKDHIYISAYLGTEVSSAIRSLSGKIPISNKTIGTMRNKAQTNGTGYQLMTYYNLLMLQVLYIVFFKNRDGQSSLGRGRVDGAGSINTGGTNNKGMFYGSTSDEQIKFCGIEDFWGNRYYWIDGLYRDINRNIMISKQDVFDDWGSGYENYGQGATADINGYIGTVQGGNETGFIIKTSDGSATTKYTDNGSLVGGRIGFFGGYQEDGDDTGAFRLRVDFNALNPSLAISARVCFIGS